MKKILLPLTLVLLTITTENVIAQSYTSFMTGDPADVGPQPEFGVVLMGGAGENDEAMKWFLQRANGGDVVVIRASGSNGYNNYMYSQLGVAVNSVETIVFNNAAAASDPYVIQQIQNAEAIWMAGGNQGTYVNYWKDNAIEQAINDLLLVKGGVVGGTSAGMAVLGGSYYSALNGSVTSAQALANPYHGNVTIGHGDFLAAPFLQNVITDTHFDNPDRRGRLTAFMARMNTDQGFLPLAIACDEYAAVCIDSSGLARCYGEAPQYEEFIYFARPNCPEPFGPEICTAGTPLTWDRGGEALKVYRIKGTMQGDLTFDLTDWLSGNGGQWLNWSVVNGVFSETSGAAAPLCPILDIAELWKEKTVLAYPNPTGGVFRISDEFVGFPMRVFNSSGTLVFHQNKMEENTIDLSGLASGLYFISGNGKTAKVILE